MDLQPKIVANLDRKKEGLKISPEYMARMARPLSVDGVLYVPKFDLTPSNVEMVGGLISNNPTLKDIALAPVEHTPEDHQRFYPYFAFRDARRTTWGMFEKDPDLPDREKYFYKQTAEELFDKYFLYKLHNNNQDPGWFQMLGPSIQKYLSAKLGMEVDSEIPPYLRFQSLPYSGIPAFEIEKVEMFEDLDEIFRLFRLSRIKQLAYKTDPAPDQNEMHFEFSHTRYAHSFKVLAVANLLAHNTGFSKEDIQILQIAAVSHDYRTPAGGDTTKMLDPSFFDEDKHYPEIFQDEKWKEFVQKNKISKEQEEDLARTVAGEGIKGQLLDIADKVAYVSLDTFMYLEEIIRIYNRGADGKLETRRNVEESKRFKMIQEMVKADPMICNIWGSVAIEDGKVFFTNGEKLGEFLKLRALLFRDLYYNPDSRFPVDQIVQRLMEHMYESGELTKEFLLKEDDGGLNIKLQNFAGTPMFPNIIRYNNHIKRKEFSSMEEARDFARGFNDDEERIVVIDSFPILSGPSTKKFSVKKDNKVVPFNEAFGDKAKEIDEIMSFPSSISVCIVPFDNLYISGSNRKKVKEIFKVE